MLLAVSKVVSIYGRGSGSAGNHKQSALAPSWLRKPYDQRLQAVLLLLATTLEAVVNLVCVLSDLYQCVKILQDQFAVDFVLAEVLIKEPFTDRDIEGSLLRSCWRWIRKVKNG